MSVYSRHDDDDDMGVPAPEPPWPGSRSEREAMAQRARDDARRIRTMPHDKHGRLMEPGDLVVGKGYNISADIVGVVLQINPIATACNLVVLTTAFVEVSQEVALHLAEAGVPYACETDGVGPRRYGRIAVRMEYGDTTSFEIVRKKDGRVPTPPLRAHDYAVTHDDVTVRIETVLQDLDQR